MHGKAAGFTLFEMVVTICTIAILYMIAEQRINDLPAAAERASFQGVLEQIKTGVTLAMVSNMARGSAGATQGLEGTNPMDYLLEKPSNYLGELAVVDDTLRRRNAWYFERRSGDLVYVVGGNSIDDVLVTIAGMQVNMGQIRFRIENLYDSGQGGVITGSRLANPAAAGRWQGVQLVPVHEFSWDSQVNVAAYQ
jgi:hypothetical protein